MINTPDIERPSKELIETLSSISSATAAGELCRLGIRDPQILGPIPRTPGKSVVGPALTLQFMPKREDIYAVDEYNDPEKQPAPSRTLSYPTRRYHRGRRKG